MQAYCWPVLTELQPLCHKTTLSSPTGKSDREDAARFTSAERAAFALHTPSEVNPESRLSLQDKVGEIYIKAPSPTQETNAIYPTRDSVVWPSVLKTQLSMQSRVEKVLLTMGKQS